MSCLQKGEVAEKILLFEGHEFYGALSGLSNDMGASIHDRKELF